MKIGIVGGGPSGLYFALLMKKSDPAHEVVVVEQNPAGATYGWGVIFSEQALSFLEPSDSDSYADIMAQMELWDDLTIVHQDERVPIDGNGFSGVARLALLTTLQAHCRRHGVQMRFEQRLTNLAVFADYDLVVAADGVNSVVRPLYAAQFGSRSEVLTNKYIWYGTPQLFDTLTLTFRQNDDGAFVAHHYRYSPQGSTFIVECDAATWERARLGEMSDEASRRYCERVFAPDLGGRPLLTNKSSWLNFRAVTNRQWSYRNIVLIGDALRTVHFSIGSGTRMALEDAIALHRACIAHPDVPDALQAFETVHRPQVEKLLGVAHGSYTWYKQFHTKMDLHPLELAYDYMMRGGRMTHERLCRIAPRFSASHAAYQENRRS